MEKKVKISPEVAAELRRGVWAGWLFTLSGETLPRPLYQAVDKVLVALGGKWNKSHGGHMFSLDGKQAMEAALDQGHAVDQKKTMEQFFTSTELADRMVDMLGVALGSHVLEPSAGTGRLVEAATLRGAIVTAVELDDRLCWELHRNIGERRHGQLFVFPGDFMTWTPVSPKPIDFVLMNPPFSANQDIAHVMRAFEFLRPGGQLVAIMSPHFTFAEDKPSREFRAMIGYGRPGNEGRADVLDASVEHLEQGTFKAAGTNVSAVLVTIEKAG